MWFQRGGYQKETANALLLLARAQRQKGDYAAALGSFDGQLRLSNQMGDPSQAALAQQGRGSVLQAQGRLPEALATFRQAYEAAHKMGDPLNSAFDMLDTADVYWRLGRYEEARQALERVGPVPRAPSPHSIARFAPHGSEPARLCRCHGVQPTRPG